MIKNKICIERGITLTSLAITIAILLILTNVIIYNAIDSLKVEHVDALKNDIANLRDLISTYYAQNGKIPVKLKYTNIEHIKQAGLISEAADTGDFYVIDLSALENLTLHYGQDYEKVKSLEEGDTSVNNYKDLYIINEASHNIFYVQGVTINNSTFYTDYSAEDIDKVPVTLRYVDNVKIPEGFYYAGGTKDTGLVISDVEGDDLENTKQGNQFVWIPVENESDYVRNTTYEDVNVSTKAYDDTGYLPDGITNEKQAVISAGGFYISRFEAGKEETNTLVSKKGATVWNNITYENSKTTAKTFINKNEVKSALISGIQWDAVMRFVDNKKDGKGNLYNVRQYTDSRHHTDVEKSGQNEEDKVCNIYDLEGNVREMVAEKTTQNSSYNVIRSGYYQSTYKLPASYRNLGDGSINKGHSFRFVLYITNDNWSPTYDETGIYKDKNGDTARIPGGFQVSQMPGQNTVNEGLVVRDENQNEFVWIPVTDDSQYVRNTNYIDTNVSSTAKDDENYLPDGITVEPGKDGEKEKEIVTKAGGFYISRYEAGKEGESTLVSKSGATVWTNIRQDDKDKEQGCKTVAKTFINNSEVKSGLITGIQWDMVMNFVNNKKDGIGKTFDVKTKDASRHTGSLAKSGQNEADKVCNIYDLEGNCWEYVAEKNGTNNPYVNRGGNCNSDYDYPASSRDNLNGSVYGYGSFRLVLYVM